MTTRFDNFKFPTSEIFPTQPARLIYLSHPVATGCEGKLSRQTLLYTIHPHTFIAPFGTPRHPSALLSNAPTSSISPPTPPVTQNQRLPGGLLFSQSSRTYPEGPSAPRPSYNPTLPPPPLPTLLCCWEDKFGADQSNIVGIPALPLS